MDAEFITIVFGRETADDISHFGQGHFEPSICNIKNFIRVEAMSLVVVGSIGFLMNIRNLQDYIEENFVITDFLQVFEGVFAFGTIHFIIVVKYP